MKTTFLILFFVATLVSASAAEQKPATVTLDDVKARIAKTEVGMTRKQFEVIAGEAWVESITAGWNSGQHSHYYNRLFPEYEIEIWYSWTGRQGIGRHDKPQDYVIRLPKLKPLKSIPTN